MIIYKSDALKQCEPGSGTSTVEMAQTLINADIPVLSSRGDHDCRVLPAICGTATGAIDTCELPVDHLSQARAHVYTSQSFTGMP